VREYLHGFKINFIKKINLLNAELRGMKIYGTGHTQKYSVIEVAENKWRDAFHILYNSQGLILYIICLYM